MKLFYRILFLCLLLISPLAQADYTLGAGDYLRVMVYGDADLTRETRVSEDGLLTFPLIGEVQVGGLTVIQAERKVADQLKKGGFIINPQVSLLILEFKSKMVSVLGGVLKPGRYPITHPTDVIDIIAEAGGFNVDASEILTVVREDTRSEYDLNEIIEKRNLHDFDFRLIGGETVYVSVRDVAVSGEVSHPGKYGIQGGTRKITDFLSIAGGTTEFAGDILFFTTMRSGKAETTKINIDQLFRSPGEELNYSLLPGDVIYVPKASQFYIYGEVQHPGMFSIDSNMTVMQAIAKAGGLTLRGTQRGIKLHRRSSDGIITKQTPSLHDSLQDQDVLYVEESIF